MRFDMRATSDFSLLVAHAFLLTFSCAMHGIVLIRAAALSVSGLHTLQGGRTEV